MAQESDSKTLKYTSLTDIKKSSLKQGETFILASVCGINKYNEKGSIDLIDNSDIQDPKQPLLIKSKIEKTKIACIKEEDIKDINIHNLLQNDKNLFKKPAFFRRTVVQTGRPNKNKIELHPLLLELAIVNEEDHSLVIHRFILPKKIKFSDIRQLIDDERLSDLKSSDLVFKKLLFRNGTISSYRGYNVSKIEDFNLNDFLYDIRVHFCCIDSDDSFVNDYADESYLALLVTKSNANSSKSVMEVQRQLSGLSYTTDSTEKTLKFESKSENTLQLNLKMTDDEETAQHTSFGERFDKLECSMKALQQSCKGLVGLKNLGNTCFMNSTLQCLSNCSLLTYYFLSNAYLQHINKSNPLGWKGKIAKKYAELLQQMWYGKESSVSPVSLKMCIGEFAPRFSGFSQQDSSELLFFLLDGLHEDLNQIKDKPNTTMVENSNLPDEVIAKEAWETYLKRNVSIIVDIFQGQIKSTVVCPSCQKLSKIFDPFLALSLPLSCDFTTKIFVTLFDGKDQARYLGVTVPKFGDVGDLKDAVLKLTGWESSDELIVFEVFDKKGYSVFKNFELISRINKIDIIYVLRTPSYWKENEKNDQKDQIDQKEKNENALSDDEVTNTIKGNTADVKRIRNDNRDNENGVPNKTEGVFFINHVIEFFDENGNSQDIKFGVPWVVRLPLFVDISVSKLYYEVLKAIQPFRAIDENQKLKTPKKIVMKNKETLNGDGGNKKELTEHNNEVIQLAHEKKCFTLIWEKKTDADFSLFEKLDKNVDKEQPEKENLRKKQTLSECLNLYCKTETLSKRNTWFCLNCKEHQRAEKKLDIWLLPKVLIIHLKRFQANYSLHQKIDLLVDFPIEGFDVSPWVSNPVERQKSCLYDLFAVSNHYGFMSGGHYTASCKNPKNKKWYRFDDERVTEICDPHSEIVESDSYVLFYQRRGFDNCDLEKLFV